MNKRTARILAIITADTETQERVCGREEPTATATAWAETDLEVNQIREYIDGDCFESDAALALHTFGISPAEAARRVDSHETIGYRVSDREISASEAVYLLLPSGF